MLKNFVDISYDYIRGLVDGEGCFCFYPGARKRGGRKYKVPTFVIAMHERDYDLLNAIKETLDLKGKLYNFKSWTGDGSNRGRKVVLVVRNFSELKDIVIPLFYKKLKGHKGRQMTDWLEKIGSDPDVTDRFKSLYRLYKWGAFDSDPVFKNKFI